MATSHGIKISRSDYGIPFRQFGRPGDDSYRYGGLVQPVIFGKNVRVLMGYPVRADSAATCESLCPQPEERANDSLAICETALRPDIHFVSVKTTRTA